MSPPSPRSPSSLPEPGIDDAPGEVQSLARGDLAIVERRRRRGELLDAAAGR